MLKVRERFGILREVIDCKRHKRFHCDHPRRNRSPQILGTKRSQGHILPLLDISCCGNAEQIMITISMYHHIFVGDISVYNVQGIEVTFCFFLFLLYLTFFPLFLWLSFFRNYYLSIIDLKNTFQTDLCKLFALKKKLKKKNVLPFFFLLILFEFFFCFFRFFFKKIKKNRIKLFLPFLGGELGPLS